MIFSGNRLPIGGAGSLAPKLRNAQSKLRIVSRGFRICCLAPLLLALASFAFALDYQINANIHYDKYPETVLDIVQSSVPALGDRPGVIVIHGSQSDKDMMFDPYCLPFVRHGFVVANVEYRAAAVDDVLQAAKWFREHAAQNKVDPKRIIVARASEGGQLVLMVGETAVFKIAPEQLDELWPQIFQWLKKHKITS